MLKPLSSLLFTLMFLTACFGPVPPTPLKNTYWALIELGGEDAYKPENRSEAHLVFHINDNSLHGSDGCNQIQAEYTQDEKHFRFESIRSTRMQCKEGMDQADAFLQALRNTDKIKIEEDQLIFYHKNVEVARFEAREGL